MSDKSKIEAFSTAGLVVILTLGAGLVFKDALVAPEAPRGMTPPREKKQHPPKQVKAKVIEKIVLARDPKDAAEIKALKEKIENIGRSIARFTIDAKKNSAEINRLHDLCEAHEIAQANSDKTIEKLKSKLAAKPKPKAELEAYRKPFPAKDDVAISPFVPRDKGAIKEITEKVTVQASKEDFDKARKALEYHIRSKRQGYKSKGDKLNEFKKKFVEDFIYHLLFYRRIEAIGAKFKKDPAKFNIASGLLWRIEGSEEFTDKEIAQFIEGTPTQTDLDNFAIDVSSTARNMRVKPAASGRVYRQLLAIYLESRKKPTDREIRTALAGH